MATNSCVLHVLVALQMVPAIPKSGQINPEELHIAFRREINHILTKPRLRLISEFRQNLDIREQ